MRSFRSESVHVNKTGLFETAECPRGLSLIISKTGGIPLKERFADAVLLSATVIREKKKKKKNTHFR